MSATRSSQLQVPVSDQDHQQGPASAAVTLVEYGDYQCPYCGSAYSVIKAVQRQMGDDLRFVFRNFPLTQMHQYAEQAAEAAEAAGAQGKFWPYHDMLYEHQDALTTEDLLGYASDLGLDVSRMTRELIDKTYAERIRDDFMGGVRSGVNGTPTFFINGNRYDGALDVGALTSALRAAMS